MRIRNMEAAASAMSIGLGSVGARCAIASGETLSYHVDSEPHHKDVVLAFSLALL